MGLVAAISRNRLIRRLFVGWLAASLATWAFSILLALYAYEEGGVGAVGLAVLVRTLPAALAAPSVALLADRHPRRTLLLASVALRGLSMAAIAASTMAAAPIAVVLAIAAAFTVASTAHKPAQAALLPQLARTPTELGSANVAWSAIDNVGFLAGSLLAGGLAQTAGLEYAFAACVIPFAAACVSLAGLPPDRRPEPLEQTSGTAELLEGVRTIMAHRDLRPLIALFAADMFVQAMVDVLLVVMAIELLEIGEGGVGWLSAAWGVGGLAGGVAALALLGRGRLALGLTFGSLLAGLPLVLIGVSPTPASAMILLVLLGVGFALIEVSLLTFTQRLASDDVLARVFGVQESIFLLMTAGGSLVAAALVGAFGAEAALVATGLLLPLLAVVHWRRLGALEAGTKVSERAFGLLRELSIFAPLPVASTETLASRMETLDFPKGTPVTRIGEVGDAFYVVDAGMLEVFAGGEQVASLGPGECFGEVALLRDEPRMATVRAKTAVRLLSLDRTDFLSGIGTHARSSRNAQRLAEERRSSVVFQREAEQEV